MSKDDEKRSHTYSAIKGEVNPCASCGHAKVSGIHFTHRITKRRHSLLYCAACDHSTNKYTNSERQAIEDWDALWENGC